MTIEGDSGGDPEDLDGNGGQRRSDAGHLSHDGDQLLRVAGEGHIVATDGEPLRDGHEFIDHDGEKKITIVPSRSFARRPRIPVILESHRSAVDRAIENKVSNCSILVNSVGTEDDDDGWIPVGGSGDRVVSDTVIDLRPIGGKSKFWPLADDDESDEEFDQSPYTPDLVRQAAVHGFGMEKLVEAEMALQDSSIQRRVEASSSPASSDTKVVLVRNIIKAWTARQRPSLTPWSGKLP